MSSPVTFQTSAVGVTCLHTERFHSTNSINIQSTFYPVRDIQTRAGPASWTTAKTILNRLFNVLRISGRVFKDSNTVTVFLEYNLKIVRLDINTIVTITMKIDTIIIRNRIGDGGDIVSRPSSGNANSTESNYFRSAYVPPLFARRIIKKKTKKLKQIYDLIKKKIRYRIAAQ